MVYLRLTARSEDIGNGYAPAHAPAPAPRDKRPGKSPRTKKHQEKVLHVDMGFFQNAMLGKKLHVDMGTEDTVRPLIKRGEHEETPGFQNFAVFCPLCIVRGTGVSVPHAY